MENIDDIKILQVNGLGGIGGSSASGEGYSDQGQIALSDQVVNSALRYRTQAPLIDSLMNKSGIQGGDINGLTQILKPQVTSCKYVFKIERMQSKSDAFIIVIRINLIQLICISSLELGLYNATLSFNLKYIEHNLHVFHSLVLMMVLLPSPPSIYYRMICE